MYRGSATDTTECSELALLQLKSNQIKYYINKVVRICPCCGAGITAFKYINTRVEYKVENYTDWKSG